MATPQEIIAAMRASADKSDRIVAAIWDDVTEHSGVEFDSLDPEIQIDMIETWRNRVREIIRE